MLCVRGIAWIGDTVRRVKERPGKRRAWPRNAEVALAK